MYTLLLIKYKSMFPLLSWYIIKQIQILLWQLGDVEELKPNLHFSLAYKIVFNNSSQNSSNNISYFEQHPFVFSCSTNKHLHNWCKKHIHSWKFDSFHICLDVICNEIKNVFWKQIQKYSIQVMNSWGVKKFHVAAAKNDWWLIRRHTIPYDLPKIECLWNLLN